MQEQMNRFKQFLKHLHLYIFRDFFLQLQITMQLPITMQNREKNYIFSIYPMKRYKIDETVDN